MPKLYTVRKPEISAFLRKPQLSDAVPFTLMFLAARCSMLGISPFAVSFFCGAYDLKSGYIAILAVAAGLISRGVGADGGRYILAMLLFWLYSRLRENYREETVASSAVCGALLFISGIVSMLYTELGIYQLMVLGIESIICSFCYVVFEKASGILVYSRKAPSEQELISGALCMGIFISGLYGVSLPPGIDVSKLITSYLIMLVSLNMSLGVAGSSGIAAGLVCSMNDVNAITLMGLYGAAAMSGNLLKSFGKYGVALGFLGGCAVTALYVGDSITVSVVEIIGACLLFAITPVRIHKIFHAFFGRAVKADVVPGDVKMREYLVSRLASASHAFSELASVYRGATEKKLRMYNKDICSIIDNVADKVCRSCPEFMNCVKGREAEAYRVMFSALGVLESKGFCKVQDAPGEFRSMCTSAEIFLCELSHEYELFVRDSLKCGEFINNRNLIISQYDEIASVFANMHDEISDGFSFRPELEERIAGELIKSGYSLRDVRVLENGIDEIEVYIRLNKKADKKILAGRLSAICGGKMSYRDSRQGGLMRFCPDFAYETEFGCKQLAKGNQAVSGDNIINFAVGSGKYYVIICDGMGSGRDAGKESRITGRLLEEFLRDGFTASTAVELVNSSLAMGMDKECFSSVDLLSLDLMTGVADFYKIGGCRSFIKRGNSVETVFSPSIPVGILPDIHLSRITKRLENDDVVIMMSDGAEGSGFGFLSSERIKKLASDERDVNEIAESVINSAVVKGCSKIRDDMTVAVIRIKRTI